MLYHVTFSAMETLPGEEPKQVTDVAIVWAESVVEASANLIESVTQTHPELYMTDINVKAVSKSPVTAVYANDSEDKFYKVRVGFKDDPQRNKYKYTYWLVQAPSLLEAIKKVKKIAEDSSAVDFEIYSGTTNGFMINQDILGEALCS